MLNSKRSHLLFALLFLGAVSYLLYTILQSNHKLPVVMSSPAFTLPDLNGQSISQDSFTGKIRLVEFIFTHCPDICPATTSNLIRLQSPLKENNWFGQRVQFLAITFDPERDTPEVLRQYAKRMGMDMSGWTVLRGQEEETKQLAARYNIDIRKLGDGQFVHTITSLLLIDGNHQVRKIYKMGEEMDNEQILKDIEALVGEAEKQ